MTWMPAAIACAAWLGAFSLQLADLGTARFDSRRLDRGARTVVRLHPVAWVVPVVAVAIVGLGVGVDVIARILFTGGSAVTAILAAFLLVAGLVAAWLIVTVAVTRPASDSYRALRDELIDLAGTRVQQDWLDGLRGRLRAIDRAGDLTERLPEPSLRSSFAWVLRRPQRVIPPVLAVLMLVLVSIFAATNPGQAWFVALAAVGFAASSALAVAGARASLALVAAVRETQVEHRADVEHLLAEAQRSSKKPVAGLGDRVARALQILREQQG